MLRILLFSAEFVQKLKFLNNSIIPCGMVLDDPLTGSRASLGVGLAEFRSDPLRSAHHSSLLRFSAKSYKNSRK
jgi:hypothetical protein